MTSRRDILRAAVPAMATIAAATVITAAANAGPISIAILEAVEHHRTAQDALETWPGYSFMEPTPELDAEYEVLSDEQIRQSWALLTLQPTGLADMLFLVRYMTEQWDEMEHLYSIGEHHHDGNWGVVAVAFINEQTRRLLGVEEAL